MKQIIKIIIIATILSEFVIQAQNQPQNQQYQWKEIENKIEIKEDKYNKHIMYIRSDIIEINENKIIRTIVFVNMPHSSPVISTIFIPSQK
ncbi:MAG: hypothetical protein AABY22_12325 [Nanoarchaeota archaeon]